MSARRGTLGVALLALASCALLAACWREERAFRPVPVAQAVRGEQLSTLVPGPAEPKREVTHPYLDNAFAISEGKRLFSWYNCVGCHANGGGGMGPPLMDGRWIYGSAPEQLFSTIAEGRPNGMPAFGRNIPPDQVWQLVAYVRSMSGQGRKDAAPGRGDSMSLGEPESMREELPPRGQGSPPA
jgi:cytochrome c oxidase cbb3-type subunit 3